LSNAYFLAQTGNPVWSIAAAGYGVYLDQSTNSQTLYSNAGSASPVKLHSMPMSVLLTYANANGYTDWQSVGGSLYDAEFNQPSIADDIGITKEAVGGWYSPVQAMLAAIAYSAAPDSSPFGTTAAHLISWNPKRSARCRTTTTSPVRSHQSPPRRPARPQRCLPRR
jgi:hypothetical protein